MSTVILKTKPVLIYLQKQYVRTSLKEFYTGKEHCDKCEQNKRIKTPTEKLYNRLPVIRTTMEERK